MPAFGCDVGRDNQTPALQHGRPEVRSGQVRRIRLAGSTAGPVDTRNRRSQTSRRLLSPHTTPSSPRCAQRALVTNSGISGHVQRNRHQPESDALSEIIAARGNNQVPPCQGSPGSRLIRVSHTLYTMASRSHVRPWASSGPISAATLRSCILAARFSSNSAQLTA